MDVVPDAVPVVVDSVVVVLEPDALDVSTMQVPNAVEAVRPVDDVPLVDMVPFMPPPSNVLPAVAELDATVDATGLVHPELPRLPRLPGLTRLIGLLTHGSSS